MNTLKLDDTNWDLTLDTSGNLVIAKNHEAIAQDVASAVRLFLGEQWYDHTAGVPYFEQILGYNPLIQFMKSKFIAAGETVPGVLSIKCFLTGPGANREIGGQLQIYNDDGIMAVVETSVLQGQAGVAPWYINAVSPEAAV